MGFKTWAYVVDVRLVNRLPLTSTQPTELARLTQPYHHDTSISSCKELQKRIVLDQLHDATLLFGRDLCHFMKNGITKTKTNIWRSINQSIIQDFKW